MYIHNVPFYRVAQGDCLSSIAARCRAGTWQDLYNHPNNAELKKSRPNPHILRPGDEVFIPDPGEEKKVECATGKMHRFHVKQPLADLRVVLRDAEGNPFGGKKYVVEVDGTKIEGKTADDGLVEVKVPLSASEATLSAWLYDGEDPEDPDVEYQLHLGHLDPHKTISGVQGRLRNLGFRVPIDGQLGEQTARAIQRFRDRYNLAPEGEDMIDDTLCEALCKAHLGA